MDLPHSLSICDSVLSIEDDDDDEFELTPPSLFGGEEELVMVYTLSLSFCSV